jgi:hypothetical protein
MTTIFLLAVILGLPAVLIAVVSYRGLRNRRLLREMPLITAVGDYSTGVLACPRCRCTSFASSPVVGRDFFAFALGPFIFGAPSRRLEKVLECVACAQQYRRGISPTSSATVAQDMAAARS